MLDSTRPITVFSNFGHTITHMATILYATAVLHLPGVFDMPYGEMLGLASVGLVLYGVAALPAGWLGDRWSQGGMMVVFFLGVGAGATVVGTADTTTQLFIGLSLLGLFASIYHPVGIAWLVANARKQGMTLGINGVFGGFGSALAPPFVGLMIDNFTWREAFVVPGLLSIAGGLALSWYRHTGRIFDVKYDRAPSAPPSAQAIKRAFFVLTLTMACNGFVYTGLTNTMPKIFETGLGADLVGSYTEIGLYVGAVIGFASLSSIAGGWLADRFSPRLIYIILWGLLIVPLALITSVLGSGLIAMMTLIMIVNTGFAAAENMLVARYTPFEWRALAYGAKFVLALGVGGLTVQLAGNLYDSSGSFDLLYLLFGGAAMMATVAALLLPSEQGTRQTTA